MQLMHFRLPMVTREVNASLHLTEADKKRLAFHEAGHALLAYDLLGPGSLAHLSIIPTARGALAVYDREGGTRSGAYCGARHVPKNDRAA